MTLNHAYALGNARDRDLRRPAGRAGQFDCRSGQLDLRIRGHDGPGHGLEAGVGFRQLRDEPAEPVPNLRQGQPHADHAGRESQGPLGLGVQKRGQGLAHLGLVGLAVYAGGRVCGAGRRHDGVGPAEPPAPADLGGVEMSLR
jgi:hypothetical protein